MAFVHFRWECEESVPVLYCYEIQLEAAVQRKGLGRCTVISLWALHALLWQPTKCMQSLHTSN